MNQSTPSQSSQSSQGIVSSKSWRRFSKVGALAAILAVSITPIASALVVTTNTLTIAPTGILDVKTNNVIVKTGIAGVATAGVYSGIQGYVQKGLYNGPNGFWDGPGINSSSAATNPNQATAVGVLDNGVAGYATWPPLEPKPLTGPEILVKYTYFGDADLDGTITGADYALIDGSVGMGASDWVFGDFDYDGVAATGADYALIDGGLAAFQLGGPLVSQGAAAVPEPGSLSLLAIGMLALARRSRSGGK